MTTKEQRISQIHADLKAHARAALSEIEQVLAEGPTSSGVGYMASDIRLSIERLLSPPKPGRG